MFIEITWKNSNGDNLKALVPSDKVQNFVNQFLERNIKPVVVMPNNDDAGEASLSIPEQTEPSIPRLCREFGRQSEALTRVHNT